MILKHKITDACAWKGADLAGDSSWIYTLSESDVAELLRAAREVQNRGLHFPNFDKDDFKVPGITSRLDEFADELENGRGFFLLRGLPLERLTDEQLNIIYFGLGLNMGSPVMQNPKGDVLGSVMNIGDPDDKNTRVYETNRTLPYHTDPSDVVGLLCVRKARRGGLSSIVSAATVYNEILDRAPEYLALLYRPMWYAHLGEGLPKRSPIFSYHAGKLTCRYLRQYIELGHELREQPLSQIEIELLDLIDSITHEDSIRLDMMLEPGDIQFANNYAVLHSRTSFEDDEQPDRRRKMLRLWLQMANARQLSPEFPGRNGFGLHRQPGA